MFDLHSLLLVLIEVGEEDSASTATTLGAADLSASQVVAPEELSERHLWVDFIRAKLIADAVNIEDQRFLQFTHRE